MSLEGKKAPGFSLEGNDGKTHSLDDYKGKTLVIYFYPKDNTPGCTKEACGFRDSHSFFTSKNVVVFGVSRDSLTSHQKFKGLYDLPFVLLSDPDASMMTAYGAFGEKVMYGKKTTGVIRSTVVIGPDGLVKKHWTKVSKSELHPQQVIEFINQSD